jgi:murein DD-endopeptidase MepM/ murein hydrolase activator NlpD
MNMNLFAQLSIIILTLGLFTGCTSRSGPPASVHYDKATTPYHTVKKGESIASIARKYGMDKRELIRVNGLESPYRIVKGQKLIVRAHKPKRKVREEVDESEMPATETVGNVPEDEDVKVKPLAPTDGVPSEASRKGEVISEGKSNPEVDDEAESESMDEDQSLEKKRKYDEDSIDEAEGRKKRPSSLPEAPAAASSYIWPVQGTTIREFNPSGKKGTQNDGINIAAARGTAVVAANNGTVFHAGNQLKGYGNLVVIKHKNNVMTVYAHLDKVSVKRGEVVSAGQTIGTVGTSGKVSETEPQIHFEIREKGKAIDPEKRLRK